MPTLLPCPSWLVDAASEIHGPFAGPMDGARGCAPRGALLPAPPAGDRRGFRLHPGPAEHPRRGAAPVLAVLRRLLARARPLGRISGRVLQGDGRGRLA